MKKKDPCSGKENEEGGFLTEARKQICEFLEHVHRVRIQYAAVNTLNENLPQGHVLLQMVFAENFICKPRARIGIVPQSLCT